MEINVSDLDAAKEEIAYLKLWLGILIVTDISLIGWLLGNYNGAPWLLTVGCLVALISIGFGCFTLHNRIESKINEVKRL
jgi:hypothetical protein